MHQLLQEAVKARANAVTPITGFAVGCALEASDGTIIYGANIESGVLAPSLCAERSAIASALSQGYRSFKRIAVIADYSKGPVPPCGICRQFLLEFAPDVEIICGNLGGEERSFSSVRELLPHAYEFPGKL